MTAAFLQQRFQLGEDIEVLWASCGAFGTDEPPQVQASASMPEDIDFHGVGNHRLIVPNARELPEQIDIANCGRQCEVESTLDRGPAPVERQTGRSASRVG